MEEKWSYDREPYGPKAQNVQFQILLEGLRKLAFAGGYKGSTPEAYQAYQMSHTAEIRDEVKDLLLAPDTDEYRFADDGQEAHMYQVDLAQMMKRYGN